MIDYNTCYHDTIERWNFIIFSNLNLARVWPLKYRKNRLDRIKKSTRRKPRETMKSAASKCIENCMRTKLQNRFNPKVLQIVNESYMHNVPEGSETHFKVVVVSDQFEGVPLIQVGLTAILYYIKYIILYYYKVRVRVSPNCH